MPEEACVDYVGATQKHKPTLTMTWKNETHRLLSKNVDTEHKHR